MPSRPTRRSAEDLATVTLESRAPSWRGEGMSALEAIAWLGGERPSQAPRCASPVLAAFVASCNDRWPDAERQLLKPYLPRIAGSGSGAAAESWRAHLLGDRALRVWALASARDAGRLAGTWGAAIRAQARRLEDVEPLSGPHSALDAAAVAAATAREIERIGALVEACADGGERVCAGAHVGAHALAVEALTSAAHAARALAAGATETATGAAVAVVEASEAAAISAADGAARALTAARRSPSRWRCSTSCCRRPSGAGGACRASA